MELDKIIEKRRSVRRYKNGADINDIKKIIGFSQNAPSWKNYQVPRYFVIADEKQAAQFAETFLPEFNQKNSANASLIITAFQKNSSGFNPDGLPVNECANEWGAYDLGLANSLLTLKASEMGYDTLIMGIRDSKAIKKALGINDFLQVMSVIAIGVRVDDKKFIKPKRFDVNDIITVIE